MLTVGQVFGKNKGAVLAYEHDLLDCTVTVTPKAVESWYQERQDYGVGRYPNDEVTDVNENFANVYWRGTTNVTYGGNTYKASTAEKITLTSGAVLYKGWYRDSQTWTMWVGNSTNYRFVVSIERGEVVVRLWKNEKNARTGRWHGRIINWQNTGDWQRPAAERLATAWVIVGADAIVSGQYK